MRTGVTAQKRSTQLENVAPLAKVTDLSTFSALPYGPQAGIWSQSTMARFSVL